MGDVISESQFAVVKHGVLKQENRGSIHVAVKTFNNDSNSFPDDVRAEIKKLINLKNPTLIQILGVIMTPPMLVSQYCEGTPLLVRLRNPKKPALPVLALYQFCKQVATGIKILGESGIFYVPLTGDLMDNEKTIKLIAPLKARDWRRGMSRRTAWMSPEDLYWKKQSPEQSTIFSYGITVWEILTDGKIPYENLTSDEIKRKSNKKQLKRPHLASKRVYDMLMLCWKSSKERPSIDNVLEEWNLAEHELLELQTVVKDLLEVLRSKTTTFHMNRDDIIKDYNQRSAPYQPHELSIESYVVGIAWEIAELVDKVITDILDLERSNEVDILLFLMNVDMERLVGVIETVQISQNWKCVVHGIRLLFVNPRTPQEETVLSHINSRFKIWRKFGKSSEVPKSEVKDKKDSTDTRKKTREKRCDAIRNPAKSTNDWEKRLRARGSNENKNEKHDKDAASVDEDLDKDSEDDVWNLSAVYTGAQEGCESEEDTEDESFHNVLPFDLS